VTQYSVNEMGNQAFSDEIARKFLLGQLSPEEQARIEGLAFVDRDIFDQLQVAQDELIDDFVYDELSSDEIKQFQKFFLAQPGRPQELRIGRALQKYLTHIESPALVPPAEAITPPEKVSFVDWFRLRPAALAFVVTALILIAIVSLWLVIRSRNRGEQPSYQAKQRESSPLPTLTSSPTSSVQTSPSPAYQHTGPPTPVPRQPAESVFATVLAPSFSTRSDNENPQTTVPHGPVRFELPVIDDNRYERYQVVLREQGKVIHSWSYNQLKEFSHGKGIQIYIPADLLQRRTSYQIIVNGLSAGKESRFIHSYYFQVRN